MSTITPIPQNSIIKLYKNVGWDNTNQDIRWFRNETERQNYLSPKLIGQWAQCSVVSPGRSIKVSGKLNEILVGNYLSFVNNDMGVPERTFFAFVTSVNYVNVNTVEIVYEIDWIQSFLFDFIIESCLVEREHVNNDTIGANTVPENIDTGEYVIRRQDSSQAGPAVYVYLLTNTTECKNQGNVVTCCEGRGYLLNDSGIQALQEFLQYMNDTPERVALITMGVAEMIGSDGLLTSFSDTKDFPRQSNFVFNGDSYTPQNNKLYCYPYNFLSVDNYNGQVEQFHWEDFEDSSVATFRRSGGPVPKPCMEFYPINYKNTDSTSAKGAQNYSLQYENFPECPYPTDTFKAWISEFGTINRATLEANVMVQGGSMIGNIMTGNFGGATANAANVVNDFYSRTQEMISHKIHGLQMNGGIGVSSINYAMSRIGFRIIHNTIRPEFARRIDRFFSRYGYRVDQPKVPNFTGRQYVNFVQTRNAHVSGNISTDAKITLESAMDNGVSIWHTDNIGMEITSNPII